MDILMAGKQERKSELTVELDNLLVRNCLDFEKQFYVLTALVVRLRFQLKNGIPYPFSVEKATAARKWYKGFLKSLRKPQYISLSSFMGFT